MVATVVSPDRDGSLDLAPDRPSSKRRGSRRSPARHECRSSPAIASVLALETLRWGPEPLDENGTSVIESRRPGRRHPGGCADVQPAPAARERAACRRRKPEVDDRVLTGADVLLAAAGQHGGARRARSRSLGRGRFEAPDGEAAETAVRRHERAAAVDRDRRAGRVTVGEVASTLPFDATGWTAN